MRISTSDLLLILGVVAVWGINFPASKIGLSEFPPLMIIGLRFVVAALLLLPFAPRIARRQLLPVAGLAFMLGPVHFGLMYEGIRGVDASLAAVVAQLHVPFATLMAAIFLGDRIGWRRGLGLALAFAGVAVIAGEPKNASDLGSIFLIVAGAFVWAVTVIQVKAMGEIDGRVVTAWSALLAIPMMALASLALESGQGAALRAAGWRGWGSVVFMGALVSAFGYAVWYRMLSRYSVSVVSPFSLLVPPVGIVSGMLWLGETLSWLDVLGALFTVAGLAVIVLRRAMVAKTPV